MLARSLAVISFLVCLPAQAEKATSALPSELAAFLGAPPNRFEQKFRRPARELRAAIELLDAGKTESAIAKLTALTGSEMGEHALFALANAYREKKDFAKSDLAAQKILRGYPGTVYADRLHDLLDGNDCGAGLRKNPEAVHQLERCLWRTPWKGWGELEAQATALYESLKSAGDPLLDPFTAECVQALPGGSALRQRIAREVPAEKLERLATLARFRTRTPTAAGVKPVQPDLDLFDSGMKLVLKGDWQGANEVFRKFEKDYPPSEHFDRAEFWIARTEDRLGHAEEARKRFQQILNESPLTYYGLEAALYLKHDWAPSFAEPAPPLEAKWEGTLLTRQALSLWRLRALMEAGLIDESREEARFLAQTRGHGAGIGQEDAAGAMMMATLFHEAGNHMAAFSHAYAALSLDPAQLNERAAGIIFPDAFAEEFAAAAEKSGVHELLLTSVAKQESAFLPNALSKADAYGLMQLLPVTAREVNPEATRATLFDPALNAEAGGAYLARLLARYQGNISLALAAYNAGPNRASQWQRELAEAPAMKKGFDPDVFIDTIPFTETRKYVANILRNYAWYKMLRKDGTISTVQELNTQWQKPAKKPETESSPPAN